MTPEQATQIVRELQAIHTTLSVMLLVVSFGVGWSSSALLSIQRSVRRQNKQ